MDNVTHHNKNNHDNTLQQSYEDDVFICNAIHCNHDKNEATLIDKVTHKNL